MELDAHGALLKRNSAAVAKLDSEVPTSFRTRYLAGR